jgi:hypothetical protein
MGVKFQIKYVSSDKSETVSEENQRLLSNAFNTLFNQDVIIYHKTDNDVHKLLVNFTMLDVHKFDNGINELLMLQLVWDPSYSMGFVFANKSNSEDITKYSEENQRRLMDDFNSAAYRRIMVIHKNPSGDEIETHLVDLQSRSIQNIRTGEFSRFCIAWW